MIAPLRVYRTPRDEAPFVRSLVQATHCQTPIAGVSVPRDSVHKPTSTDLCREPKTVPVLELAHSNLLAAMSVDRRTRRQWRTRRRPSPSLFDDTFLSPPRLKIDAADLPVGNPSRRHAADSPVGNPSRWRAVGSPAGNPSQRRAADSLAGSPLRWRAGGSLAGSPSRRKRNWRLHSRRPKRLD